MTQQQKEAGLKAFHYDLVIHAEDAAQADRVMVERTGYDEDLSEYGVSEYTINADPAGGRAPAPIEMEEEKMLPPAISTEGELTSVNAAQYLTVLRINKALSGGYRLPAARRVSIVAGQPLLELIYNGDILVRLDDDGALHSLDQLSDGHWFEAYGSPLHRYLEHDLERQAD